MLSRIRDKHMKKILWGMIIIIVPIFVLWGGLSSLKGRNRDVIAIFNGQKIKSEEFQKYISTAQLYILINISKPSEVTFNEIQMLAVDFIILLDEAKREKIQVADSDVINYIKSHPLTANFFIKGQFDNEAYEGFLKRLSQYYRIPLNPRLFEGYIHSFLTIEKLIDKSTNISVSDDEIRMLYSRANQKAKIAYLFTPYVKFRVDIGVSENELTDFFQKNQDRFVIEEKRKLQYILIDSDSPDKEAIKKASTESVKLSELSEEFSLEIKETGFLGIADPIKNMGWEPQVNIIAFSLEEGQISEPIETQKELVIIQLVDKKPSHTPALDIIHNEVKNTYIADKAKKEAQSFSQDLLDKINKEKDKNLKTFAQKDYAEFKETDYFGYTDYIEGLGLDQLMNEKIFSLDNLEVYPEPILLVSGASIVQLVEKTPIDESDFNNQKNEYMTKLRQVKTMMAKEQFITSIRRKADLTFTQQLQN